MNKKVASLLKSLNVPDDVIGKLSDPETKEKDGPADVDVEQVSASVRTNLKTALENDEGFLQPLQDQIRGKERSTVENKLRGFLGMSNADFEAIEKKGRLDKLLVMAKEKVDATGEGGADVEELKKQIEEEKRQKVELKDKLEDYEKNKIPEIQSQVDKKMRAIDLNQKAIGVQKAMTTREKNRKELIIDNNAAHKLVMSSIQEKYDLDLSEDGEEIVVMQKGKNMKAFVNDKPVSFSELYESSHATNGLIRESAGGDPGDGKEGSKGNGKPGSGSPEKSKYSLPGLNKAQQSIKEHGKKA